MKMFSLRVNFGLVILFLFFILNFFCINNNRVDAWDISRRVGPLIEAKANQCGNRPIVPLFFTQDRNPDEVKACENDMLAQKCPFKNYPWSCIRIF
jgi:hypothetical protein